jgi:hypothetical protein
MAIDIYTVVCVDDECVRYDMYKFIQDTQNVAILTHDYGRVIPHYISGKGFQFVKLDRENIWGMVDYYKLSENKLDVHSTQLTISNSCIEDKRKLRHIRKDIRKMGFMENGKNKFRKTFDSIEDLVKFSGGMYGKAVRRNEIISELLDESDMCK